MNQTTPGRIYPPNAAMRKSLEYMLENFYESICLDDLADVAQISKFDLCRAYKRFCGISPMRFLWAFRTILAAEYIKLQPGWNLTNVCFACGFNSSAHFSRMFKKLYGVSPVSFKKENSRDLSGAATGEELNQLTLAVMTRTLSGEAPGLNGGGIAAM